MGLAVVRTGPLLPIRQLRHGPGHELLTEAPPGTRPWLVVADELAVWPKTANHRRLWAAITSAQPKVPGAPLLVTTAGSPVGIGAELWQNATSQPQHWRTPITPGPIAVVVQRHRGSTGQPERVRVATTVLCEWAEGDDTLTTAETWQPAPGEASAPWPPTPARRTTPRWTWAHDAT